MVRKFRHTLLFTNLFFVVIYLNGSGSQTLGFKKIVHKVSLANPVDTKEGPSDYSIVEKVRKSGEPKEYYMDVQSVYCLDSVCKVVPVRLYWDILGNYKRYRLFATYQLEKNKGKPFTKGNYEKLDQILHDKNSPFKSVSINEIMQVHNADGVDAVSGATTLIMDENATVKGAALTCFTLWHWVNGDVTDSIRQISGNALTISQLRSYLNANNDFKRFAVEQLTMRHAFDPKTVAAVIYDSISSPADWSKLQISYLKQSPDDIYFSSIQHLLDSGNENQRVASLNALLTTQRKVPENYFDELCVVLPKMDSYQVVDLFLKLMEYKNQGSQTAIEKSLLLLDKDILIARRAFWFLTKNTLTKKQEESVRNFKMKYKDYL